ncbi:hypothetical protein VOWphi5012_020 [Vibrio phage phi50-12]|uniref:Uncharacterized protein n=1 Tax=Vibrio phage phi50-12 TaxID=2654972 RepID=A0A5P8PR76_9CAUD|nr:hypothetical protein KNU82_gp020 [Vibrio phage phi50-12]QFR59804.1 hypothetical protein VOWphi5012_020 [Vibrio phage phi50-12]
MSSMIMGGRSAGKSLHRSPYKEVTAIVQFNHDGMEKVLEQELGKSVENYLTSMLQVLPKEPTKVVLFKNHHFYKYFCEGTGTYLESPINPSNSEFIWFTVIMEKEE